ncbi:hypothetical protein LIER_23051 [Lithospermum erythrorhizon]|uniref:Uncharacterized protein n=1 Tax=Lithospermum erythrorhizon TaxID=34254 RepID=A0AAV3R097_LITER
MVDPPKTTDPSGNSGRRKITFLEGTETKPVNDPDKLFDWRCIQALLVQWVLNTIDPAIKKQVSFYEKVSPLWEMLKKRYSASHATRKQQLEFELAACVWYYIAVDDYEEPLPYLDTTYQKIREEESLRKASDAPIGNEFVALSLRSNPRMGDYVGYPEWWETRNRKGVHSGAAASWGRGAGVGSAAGNRVAGGSAAGAGAALHVVFSDRADAARSQGGAGTIPAISQD